jgi:hypothetical protein
LVNQPATLKHFRALKGLASRPTSCKLSPAALKGAAT